MPANPFRVSNPWLQALVLLAAGAALPAGVRAAHAPPAPVQSAAASAMIEGRVFNGRSGLALENARVTVEGTPLIVFTDPDGVFRLPNQSPGQVRLRVFFTGMAPQTVEITLGPGETVQRDITLSGVDSEAAGADGTVVKLDRFVVDVSREMNATAMAINEQRFAANIKDVVTTDDFGAVAEGNVAEFLKFLPGVTVDLSGGDSRTVSIDGAPAANTPITIGGINLPAPGNNDTSRAVEVGFFNLNNVSRIEVWQSPTPESPGSSLAGSVNLVPRSSFERTRPVFNGSVYMMMRDDLLTLGKQPNMYRDPRRVVHPGFDLAWTVPVNRQFGFSVAAGMSSQFSHQIGHTNAWRGVDQVTNGNAFPHTVPGQPYLSSYTIGNAPKQSDRKSFGATVDYRLSPRDRLALSFQYSAFDGWTAARNLVFNHYRPIGFRHFPNSCAQKNGSVAAL